MMELFDACAGFGGAEPGKPEVVSAAALAEEMARLSIGRALVRIAPTGLDSDVIASNEALRAACAEFDGFVACPIVLPDGGGDVPGAGEQVAALLAAGAGAVCVRPARDRWIVRDWVCGRLFDALSVCRVPVFCDQAELPVGGLAELAGRWPDVPFLFKPDGFRHLRVLGPLLKTFPGVHLIVGGRFTVHRGIESLVGRLGPERMLFGSDFPTSEPMAAITQLMYADIADADRELIGSGNLRRLIGGIRR